MWHDGTGYEDHSVLLHDTCSLVGTNVSGELYQGIEDRILSWRWRQQVSVKCNIGAYLPDYTVLHSNLRPFIFCKFLTQESESLTRPLLNSAVVSSW